MPADRDIPAAVIDVGWVGEAIWEPEAVDAALALLRAFGYTGISQVELKRDPRDRKFKLMEINPRLWQWHALAGTCGVDVARIAYDDVGGAPDEARPCVKAVFALDDPRPGLVHLTRVVRSALP